MEELNSRLNSTYRKLETINAEAGSVVEETVKEVQALLGFKKIIAFSGGGEGLQIDFDDEVVQKKIKEQGDHVKEQIVRDIMMRLSDYEVAILTGGTAWDIPKIATDIAREYGLPTIGIMPRRGEKYSIGKDGLNIEIIADNAYGESHFGDESAIFAKLADGMFIIRGGSGTLVEFSHVMKINEANHKYDKPIKKVAPINGIGGLSELIHHIPGKAEIKQVALPKTPIYNGKDAFNWMKQELDLQDIQKEQYR